MKRILTLFLFVAGLLLPSVAHAQFITVSGILQDPNGAPYANCTLVVTFNPAPGATQAPTINGQPFPTVIPLANCNSYGYFTVQNVADNLLVQDGHPAGQQSSTWSFRFCSGPGYVPQVCFIYTSVITRSPSTGNTIDISTQLSAIPPPILPKPGGGGGGGGTPGPPGPQGPSGQAATIAVGTTSTGAPGTAATVSNSGTSSAATFNFVIPQGIQGPQGVQGLPGQALNWQQNGVSVGGTPTTINCFTNVTCMLSGTTLNISASGGGGGITLPSGSITGDILMVGAGSTVAANPPGLTDSTSSPVSAATFTPNCGGVTDTGDRGKIFVVTVTTTITIPAAGSTGCAKALFYFLIQSGTATFNRTSPDTFDSYNGTTAQSALLTYSATAGQYLTVSNGSGSNWHFLVEGGGGTTVQWQQNGTLLGTPTTINCTTNVTCTFATNTVTMSATGGTGPANAALKPAATSGIIYLDNVNGNDANDGLSWGSAKATLVNSYASLPANGGTIYMAKNWGTCLNLPAAGLLLNVLHKTVIIQGAGAYSTCLQYNGTGVGITLDTGESSSIRDVYLESTANVNNNGINVGGTNGCNKCSFTHFNVVGFSADVTLVNGAYGTLWEHDQLGSCYNNPGGSVAMSIYGTNADDTRISDSEFLNCNNFIFLNNTGAVWASKTVFENAFASANPAIWVVVNGDGSFNCDQCHWFNLATGAATYWIQSLGATTGGYITVNASTFESQRNGAAIVAPVTINNTALFNMTNCIIKHTGTETTTEFANVTGTAPTPRVPPWSANNIITNTTTVPKLYNVTPQ